MHSEPQRWVFREDSMMRKAAALENTCAESHGVGFLGKTLSKTQGKPILA